MARAVFAGSPFRSISAMRPARIVNPTTIGGWPGASGTTIAGRAVDDRRPGIRGEARPEPLDLARDAPPHRAIARSGERSAAAAVERGTRRPDRGPEQCLEVAGPGRRQERVDDPPLDGEVGVRDRAPPTDPPPSAAGQLARGGGRPLDDRRDLVERDGRTRRGGRTRGARAATASRGRRAARARPSRRGRRRPRGCRGAARPPAAHDRLRQPRPGVGLAPRRARPEHVEADPADRDREPATQVIGASRVAPIEADPCLLDGVVGLGHRAEHPVADAAQVGAMALELVGQPFASLRPGLGHRRCHHLLYGSRRECDRRPRWGRSRSPAPFRVQCDGPGLDRPAAKRRSTSS